MNTSMSRPDLAAVRTACASVQDPEFGLSIDDLGLIYDVALDEAGRVAVALTLTTPYCPAGNVIVDAVTAAAAAVPGVTAVDVRLVWDPAWTPEMVSAQGREYLGWSR
jgi:metal-sulfur cluster biosynthetic enzyme